MSEQTKRQLHLDFIDVLQVERRTYHLSGIAYRLQNSPEDSLRPVITSEDSRFNSLMQIPVESNLFVTCGQRCVALEVGFTDYESGDTEFMSWKKFTEMGRPTEYTRTVVYSVPEKK